VNELLNPSPGNLILVVAPHAGGAIMLDLIAHLACRGPLRLLDGGNRFDVYHCNLAVAKALQDETSKLPAVLEHIQLARAFTCYQVVSLLAAIPAETFPTLVLDLLATFYDESASFDESYRLLRQSLEHLRRLNRLAPVAVSARPSPLGGRPELLEILKEAAGQVWTLEPELLPAAPRLFD